MRSAACEFGGANHLLLYSSSRRRRALIAVGVEMMQKVHQWISLLALLGLAARTSAQHLSFGGCPKVSVLQHFQPTLVRR
jgi:hypothetical protein